jgi:hypothetical protein
LLDAPWPLTKARRINPVLHSPLKHDLEAHTNAQHRATSSNALVDNFFAAHLAKPRHYCCKRAHTWNDQAMCLKGFLAVVRQPDICARMLERFQR